MRAKTELGACAGERPLAPGGWARRGVRATVRLALAAALALAGALLAGPLTAQAADPSPPIASTPGAGAVEHCAPPGARILAADQRHEVYAVGEGAYACDPAQGAPIVLEARGPERAGRVGAARAVLARNVVALVVTRSGIDTSCSEILVVDLVLGTDVRPPLPIGCSVDAGFVALHEVAALVVSPRGSVAWALVSGRNGAGRVSVVAAPRGRPATTLDPGPGVVPASLALHRGVLSWRDAGSSRSARI